MSWRCSQDRSNTACESYQQPPANVVKVTNYLCSLRGTISETSLGEIFSHSLVIASTKSAAQVAGVITAAWEAALNTGSAPTLRQRFPSSVKWVEGTAAQILDLNTGKLAPAAHVRYGTAWVGTHGSPMLPSQTAVAISLMGGTHANGTPLKGRFYLPPLTVAAVDSSNKGMLDDLVLAGIVTACTTFLNTIFAGGDEASVWSRKDGTVHRVTQLRVGNKFDTIRKRRNALPETYTIATGLTPPAL